MRSGDFLRTADGQIWVVGARFRISKGYARQHGIPSGKNVFAARFDTQEDGKERVVCDWFPFDRALALRIGVIEARRMGLPVHDDVERTYQLNGAPVRLHDFDYWRFAAFTDQQGNTGLIWWWQVMLALMRNRTLGAISAMRVATPGEVL